LSFICDTFSFELRFPRLKASIERLFDVSAWSTGLLAANDDWAYGIPTRVVKELKEHWQTKYEWAAVEKKLNRHPHSKAEVNGIHLHSVHVSSKNKDAIPLWVGETTS
jgi:hypothetical protein